MTDMDDDGRRSAPHVARNAGPIIDVLKTMLPSRGLVLELASGTGEHVVHFARAFSDLHFQPSDLDPVSLASIEAWRMSSGLPNLLPSVEIDVRGWPWPVGGCAAVLAINVVHISPWDATVGLFHGAGRLLEPGGFLYFYGPFRRAGVETAPSNEAFDRSLRSRNPEWGLRNLEAVADEAAANGLELADVIPMPANNLSVLFRREQAQR